MLPQGNKTAAIALVCAFLGYQFLIHKVTLSYQLTPIAAALVLIPFVAAAGWAIALELGWRLALLTAATMTILGVAWVNEFGLPVIIFGLPHLVTNLFLMWLFARTLKDGREPLITSIARRVHGSLKPELEIYTRRVTYAWSLFFLLQVVVSLGLYIFASLQTWSMYINVLSVPLVILMFVCEYTYRVLRYRDHQSSILSGLQFFTHKKPEPKPTKGR